MRIAYILRSFPSLTETFILNEILELVNNGIDIRIFSISRPQEKKRHTHVEELMGRVTYLAESRKAFKTFGRVRLCFRFFLKDPLTFLRALYSAVRIGGRALRRGVYWAKEFESMGIDHIHAHFADTPTTFAMIISMLTGIPYSFSIHARDLFVDPKAMPVKLSKAKGVITHCNYNRAYILRHWPVLSPDRIETIHCTVDCKCFSREKAYVKNGNTIVSVGRLVEKKGFPYLIEACTELKKRGMSFTCVIAGDGPQKEALERMIREKELDSTIQLLGARNRDEVKELLEEATIFALPSVETEEGDRDSLPTAIKEAMAMGIPVVASEDDSISELIRNGSGVLVPPRDSRSLADAFERLLNASEIELKAMGERAQEIVTKEFTIESQSHKLIYFFTTQLQQLVKP